MRVQPSRQTVATRRGGLAALCSVAVGVGATALSMPHAMADETETAATELEEVVVTARQRSENVQRVPDSVSVFTEKDIESARIQSIPDGLRLVPSVEFIDSQDAGLATISIRGVGQVRNGEAPVAIVIDGVQVATPDQIKEQLNDVESIEVLKGPQGALYGRNAIGGAIVVTTKDPGQQLNGHVELGGGNGGDQSYDASLAGPLPLDHLFFRIGGRYEDFDGVIQNVTLDKKVDFFVDKSLHGQLLWTPSDTFRLDARAQWSDRNGGASWYIPIGDGQPNNLTVPVQANELGRSELNVEDVSVRADYKLGGGTLRSITARSKVSVRLFESLGWTPTTPLAATQGRQTNTWNEDLRFTSDSEQRTRWVVGAFFQHADNGLDTTVLLEPRPFIAIPSADTARESLASAGYGQLNYDILKSLELTLALRYDRNELNQSNLLARGAPATTEFSAWQPKLSLSYKFDAAMLYATVGRGFRSGGFNPPDGGFALIYPAETTTSVEGGVKSSWLDSRLEANAAVFQTHFKNQQQFVLNGANQGIVSIDQSTISGAELELRAKPTARLQLGISLSRLDSTIDNYDGTSLYRGNHVPLTVGFSSTLTAQYTQPVGSGQLSFRADYVRRDDMYWFVDNADRDAPVDLVNARIAYDLGAWEAAIWSKNALDKRYTEEFFAKEYLGLPEDIRYPGTPRLYGATLSYHF